MPRYAQINMETGIIDGDSHLRDVGEEKIYPHLIPISDDFDLFNKKWDFNKKNWVEIIPKIIEEKTNNN